MRRKKNNQCISCEGCDMKSLLVFKHQYVTNKYFDKLEELYNQFSHDIKISVCNKCSLIQQTQPFPVNQLKPKNTWAIKYSEPEEHLDDLAESIEKVIKNKNNTKILGLSYKDESFINRMQKKGYKKSYVLDTKTDLKIKNVAGAESIQAAFSDKAEYIRNNYGLQDLIVVRHLLEHVYDVKKFILSLLSLLSPKGMILFEVPGCDKTIKYLDYTTIWEEHISYYTEFSFLNTLTSSKLAPLNYSVVEYPLENSLIALCKYKPDENKVLNKQKLNEEIEKAVVFGDKFDYVRKMICSQLKKNNLNVIFGAGHLSTCFINYFKLKKYFKLIIDDDSDKNNKYISGAGLHIYHSDKLKNIKNVKCFLGLNPRNEQKVITKNNYIIKNGGKFYSIFPSSKYWMNTY